MGMFMETAIIQNCGADEVKAVLKQMEAFPGMDLKPEECRFQEMNGGVCVLFNEYCAGYGNFAKALSEKLAGPVLHLYMYDGDFWGYFFCENGELLDEFNPMPDYFEEASEEERRRLAGNAALLAERFQADEEALAGLLGTWTKDMMENDETGRCDCWAMADFMDRLGWSYPWG